MNCDRCGNKLVRIKPLNICSVVTDETPHVITYTLCDKCTDELFDFLGPGIPSVDMCFGNTEE